MLLGRSSCHSERLIPNWSKGKCGDVQGRLLYLPVGGDRCQLRSTSTASSTAGLGGAPLVVRPSGALLEPYRSIHTHSHFSLLLLLSFLQLFFLLLFFPFLFQPETGAYAPRGAERSLPSSFGLLGGQRRGRTFELLTAALLPLLELLQEQPQEVLLPGWCAPCAGLGKGLRLRRQDSRSLRSFGD